MGTPRAFKIAAFVAILGSGAWMFCLHYVLLPRIDFLPHAQMPAWTMNNGIAEVSMPKQFMIAEAAEFDSEFLAYLLGAHMRHSPEFVRTEVLLNHRRVDGEPRTSIVLNLPNDLLYSIPLLADLESRGRASAFEWRFVPKSTVLHMRSQTSVFFSAYNLPIRKRLEEIPRPVLTNYLRRFLRYKSLTDGRVLRRIEPVPSPLRSDEAHQLAGDIITVAEFFSLPLDLFVGIGAMENNYMNVRGDLENTAWKRRAEPGDIIIKRRKGRVQVLNDSAGVWQITRETLRYVHKLYLKDTRDYSQLPERLRPPLDLDIEGVPAEVLTTYAGLLLRDLLDQFDGDTAKAVGAYNGGPSRPNMAYEEGVRRIAGYARDLVERGASLHGTAIPEMQFLRP
jgi:hypothetical protein